MAEPVLHVGGPSPQGEGQRLGLLRAGRRLMLGRSRFVNLWLFLGATAAFAAAVFTVVEYKLGDAGFYTALGVYAVVGIGGAVAAKAANGLRIMAQWRARGLPAAQTLTYAIDDEALQIGSDTGVTRISWRYVSEIAPAGKYWLLPAGGQFYFLPRRFFASPQAEVDFLAAMLARMSPAARERSGQARKLTMFA